MALSAQCTSSITRPTGDRCATAPSSSATPANSRSRSPSPPAGASAVVAGSCGSSRSISPRTNGGQASSAASSSRPSSRRLSSPSAPATGSSGSFPASGRHAPHSATIPLAAARRIASWVNRVLPTPASPATSSRRASPPSAARRQDNSRARPTKPADPAIPPAHQPTRSWSTPFRRSGAAGWSRPGRRQGAAMGTSRTRGTILLHHPIPGASWTVPLLLHAAVSRGVCTRCSDCTHDPVAGVGTRRRNRTAVRVRFGQYVGRLRLGARLGGYRVSHDRRAVTVGNEAPVWPSPAPRTATTTSSTTSPV